MWEVGKENGTDRASLKAHRERGLKPGFAR